MKRFVIAAALAAASTSTFAQTHEELLRDANSGNTAYSLLENLARQTGGQFYFSPDSQKLEVLYGQIAAE